MVFYYMKTKLLFFNASRSFCSNKISSPSNTFIPSLLQKITDNQLRVKAPTPNPLISRTLSLNRFHLVSAMVGVRQLVHNSHGFRLGTRRFYHFNPNSSQTQRIFRAFVRVSERAKQSLGKLTAGEVAATVLLGSCLFVFFFGGKLERVPYSNRFHYALSDKLERKLGEYYWKRYEKENRERILLSSDPRTIRVQSIARNILEAMNKGLMLQHHAIIVQTSESTSTLLNHKAQNFGASGNFEVEPDGSCQKMIQQSQNRTRKLLWKPATKHLDGKVWEVYVADRYSDNAECHLGGKIVIYSGCLRSLKSDAEVATVIAHEIGHAVARHGAECLMRAFVLITLMSLILFADSEGIIYSSGLQHLMRLIQSFFTRRRETEADYIGLMLMASAGYDPEVAPIVYEEETGDKPDANLFDTHYSGKKRAKLLKKAKTMELAKQVFKEVKAGYEVRSFL